MPSARCPGRRSRPLGRPRVCRPYPRRRSPSLHTLRASPLDDAGRARRTARSRQADRQQPAARPGSRRSPDPGTVRGRPTFGDPDHHRARPATCRMRSIAAVARSSRPPGPRSTESDRTALVAATPPLRRLADLLHASTHPASGNEARPMTGVAPTSVPESVADYAALPGPGGQRSKLPALDAKRWTLRVALSQRPWSFVASIAMAAAFVCNGLTPVVVGQAVDEAIATSSLQRLGFWILVLAGLYLLAIGVNWIARFMLVRSQQLVSHDLRTTVTDRIQDPRGFAGRERTPGGLLLIASADTQRVGEIVMMTVMPVAEAASITYGAIMMYTINPWLSLATLVGGPLLVIVALRVGRPLQRRSIARQQSIAQAAATAADVVQGLRILKGTGRDHHRPRSLRRGVRDCVRQDGPGQRGRGTSQRCHRRHRCDLRLQSRHRRRCARSPRGRDDRSAHHRRGPDPVLDHSDDDARPEPRFAMGLGGGVRTADPRSPRCRLRAQRRGGLGADHPLHRRAAHRPHRRPRCRPRAGRRGSSRCPGPG